MPLTKSGSARNPSLTVDSNDNCYVAWQDNRDGNNEIYFQKIPVNFARATGTAVGAAAIIRDTQPAITAQSATVEAPTLVAPEKDQQNVSSIRPTFEWQHRRPVTSNQQLVTSYQIDVAKNDTFSIAAQTFSKASGAGTADQTDPALYRYTYAIHEFDPGLDRDTYYWKVTALTTNEAATSEVWSFKIAPELTLTGVTNYPNPFNPNREKTKIRYRLSTDASEAKIRIYDITGSLVNELDGTTNGESVNIWSKYNDIEWDGRNGRGDVVVNGIYPFEVVARLGDKSVSGRGKIAVLK
jgi:hypothetical protein